MIRCSWSFHKFYIYCSPPPILTNLTNRRHRNLSFYFLSIGLMSGLTMGILSLDLTTLMTLKNAGTPTEQKYAKRILPVVKQHHLLLVTLLVANAGAVESMPIFLDRVSNPIIAIVISVTAVLIFGEWVCVFHLHRPLKLTGYIHLLIFIACHPFPDKNLPWFLSQEIFPSSWVMGFILKINP